MSYSQCNNYRMMGDAASDLHFVQCRECRTLSGQSEDVYEIAAGDSALIK